jgi:UDP-GlcNAc:undecaprenyl-phosphate/decaprenyl-phosphate GlcNAc-1-phosphate transferase
MSPAELCLLLAATILPSSLVSLSVVWIMRRSAANWGLIDLPGQRKVHTTPTPRGGGLGIIAGVLATFTVVTLVVLLASNGNEALILGVRLPEIMARHLSGLRSQLPSLWVLLGCATVLGLLGLADDRGSVDWRLRLLVEFAVAAFCVTWEQWRLTAFLPVPFLADALSIIWIVALINSFNMLDNMDALSGGVAAICASILGAVMLLTPEGASAGPQLFVAGFLFVLVGGLLGFLWHNRPPARIFMGDCGAYFIGFCIAIATMLATFVGTGSPKPHSILAPVFVLAIPLYDLVSVILIRLRSGASPFEADKNHFSHRLVELGLSKSQAVLTIYLICLTCGFAALLLHRTDAVGAILLTALVACIMTIIAILEFVARRKQKEMTG